MSLLLIIVLLCCSCGNLHEECKEELSELEIRIDALQDENQSLQEQIMHYEVRLDEIRGCLYTVEDYFDGKYDFMDEEEAIGYFYNAIELTQSSLYNQLPTPAPTMSNYDIALRFALGLD